MTDWENLKSDMKVAGNDILTNITEETLVDDILSKHTNVIEDGINKFIPTSLTAFVTEI